MTSFTRYTSHILLITLLSIGGVAYAEENTHTNSTQAEATINIETKASSPKIEERKGMFDMIKARLGIKAETKAEIKDVRKDSQEKIKEIRANASTTVKTMRDTLKASTTEMKKDMQERKEENRREKEREVKHRFGQMIERFRNTVTRLENILSRVETRITKIKAAGGNTATSEKYALETKTHLTAAKTSLITLEATASTTAQVETSVGSNASTTKAKMNELRKAAEVTKKHIKEAHTSLERAISNLKGIGIHATTTATTTISN
jgi:hypothetical protein